MEFHGFTAGLSMILGGIVASIVLVAIVRRMFSKEILREAHDITGNLLSVVGTLYAVLLGLVVVDALVIGLNLYLISLFGYPFSGDLTVSSRPFQVDIAIFDGRFDDVPMHGRERTAK